MIAEAACDAITGVEISADPDKHYQRVPPHESGVIHIVGPKSQTAGDELKLTLQVADGTDTSKITVSGATQGDSPLELLVPITESVRQRVIVSYDDSPCREIHVWPVWADIKNFRGSNANGEPLSGNNNPENGLPSGMLGTPPAVPARAVMGGSTTGILFNAMELRADISPKGVSALQGVQFDFKRTIHAKTWARNANDQEWTLIEGPPFTLGPTGDDEDNRDEDLHDRNDVIWVHDTPGLSFSIDEPANADFVTRVMNFTETVNLILMQDDNSVTAMSGPLISDEFDWHSILNGKLVTIDGIGQFERNLDRTNIIAPGHVALGNQP